MIEDTSDVIRQYEDQDLNDLLTAWAAASEIAHPFLSEEFLASERENIPNLYLPNAETWVFEASGQVVGFIALIGNEVGAIFVHPGHQRMGVGQRLMDKAKELREELEVEVFVKNAMKGGEYSIRPSIPLNESSDNSKPIHASPPPNGDSICFASSAENPNRG
jgi:putative acetyltransferase